MSNLTISIDDAIIKRARVRAIQQGTSLSAKVREFLQGYVNESDDAMRKQRKDSTARLIAAIDSATKRASAVTATAAGRSKQRRTLRDEIYEGDFRAAERAKSAKTPGTRSR